VWDRCGQSRNETASRLTDDPFFLIAYRRKMAAAAQAGHDPSSIFRRRFRNAPRSSSDAISANAKRISSVNASECAKSNDRRSMLASTSIRMLTFVRREFYRSPINFQALFPVVFAHAFAIVDGLDQIPKIENEGQARTYRDIETRLNSDWRAKGKDAFVEFTRSRVGILANAYGVRLLEWEDAEEDDDLDD